jgi:hypothetical protein
VEKALEKVTRAYAKLEVEL